MIKDVGCEFFMFIHCDRGCAINYPLCTVYVYVSSFPWILIDVSSHTATIENIFYKENTFYFNQHLVIHIQEMK